MLDLIREMWVVFFFFFDLEFSGNVGNKKAVVKKPTVLTWFLLERNALKTRTMWWHLGRTGSVACELEHR